MKGTHLRLQYLYQRFINDEASADETREFWERIRQADDNDAIKDVVFKLYGEDVPGEIEKKEWGDSIKRIVSEQDSHPYRIHSKWWWAAASALILLGTFSYFQFAGKKETRGGTHSLASGADQHDIQPPALNRATITLANGKKIFLDSSGNGMLATQNNVALKKTADGAIVYDPESPSPDSKMIYNTLTNPKGSRVINMTLSDGSHVWLNSGSSVTFPVVFSGGERKVSINGEAYFEVAHDAQTKFIVVANGLSTEVLGTHFNVNAYDDEQAVKVTLLEGSVKVVSADGHSTTISPGEQAVKPLAGMLKTNRHVDIEEVIAWKNERFSFNDTGIKEIMKEVSRWYDVNIEYEGDMNGLSFGGNMSRQQNVSELLKRLEATKAVQFKVNGRTITVKQVQ